MKSDISRQTFDPTNHYKSVRMQQGRVQLDADWNEESDITIHRIETEALDLIGGCGGPMHAAAFGITTGGKPIFPVTRSEFVAEADFLLSAGRYYVDGILCQNESVVSFTTQPDYPILAGDLHIPPLKPGQGGYLAYLDVWERNITAIDDPQIREVALGGPDTATRSRTVWQVKLFAAGRGDNCVTAFDNLLKAHPPSSGTLRAKTESEAISPNPCIVPPGAGFRGLENQLYRIEIHGGGAAFNVAGGAAGTVISEITGERNNQVKTTGVWAEGKAVEIFSGDAPTNLKSRILAYIIKVEKVDGTSTLTLNTSITNLTMGNNPRIREVNASFKWSRDNGSVATAIERIQGREITVSHTGLDSVLGFAPNQWVEIIDDALELNGRPGQLAQIAEVNSAQRLIILRTAPALLDADSGNGVNPAFHPKLVRWDGIGGVNADSNLASSGYIDIEDGVQVRFGAGTYSTGDYWLIPARTATTGAQSGKIEWPLDGGGNALALSPFGIRHHYCPLALLSFSQSGGFALIDDCRHLFPPVTELTSLFYVSGDGQEAMPVPLLSGNPLPLPTDPPSTLKQPLKRSLKQPLRQALQPFDLVPLAQSLVVGVANGSWPVTGAMVRFQIVEVAGSASGGLVPAPDSGGVVNATGKIVDVKTDGKGLARCDWHISPVTQSQQVKATLLGADGEPIHLPVIFTANLSVAGQVAYNPPSSCATLQNQTTVQKALDRLSLLPSLYYVSGDDQEVMPGETLQPLKVLVANRCGPVTSASVDFEVISGGGTISMGLPTGDGITTCNWTLGTSAHRQEVEATLVGNSQNPVAAPTRVRFSATLSTADHVSYDPAGCPDFRSAAMTVQQALDLLCQRKPGSGGCAVTVGNGGQFATLEEALNSLLAVGPDFRNVDICICLMPGDHVLENDLSMNGAENKVQIKIEGCGHGTRIMMGQNSLTGLNLVAFKLRDVEVFAEGKASFNFDRSDDVTFEDCYLTQENQTVPFITIAHGRRIQIEGNFIETYLPLPSNAILPDKVFEEVDPGISELLATRKKPDFDKRASNIASTLAGLSPKGKQAYIKKFEQSLAKLDNLTAGESKSYNGFRQAVSAQVANASSIRASLIEISVAAFRGEPGTSIALIDAEADTWIESNNITGVVCLYGAPENIRFTAEEMRLLSARLVKGQIVFSNSLSSLQVRDNVIYRIDVSGDMSRLLKGFAISNNASDPLVGCYRRCFITDNAISGGNNAFVVEHLALTSNSFDPERGLNAGMVIANAAISVANYAPKEIILSVVARDKRETANLGIVIQNV